MMTTCWTVLCSVGVGGGVGAAAGEEPPPQPSSNITLGSSRTKLQIELERIGDNPTPRGTLRTDNVVPTPFRVDGCSVELVGYQIKIKDISEPALSDACKFGDSFFISSKRW